MSQFTSESEFNLEKRVHITNEIPPYDMYDSLNSVLQNDLWKWVLGSTVVDFNLPYTILEQNEMGEAVPVHDIDTKEVYYKMINGQVSEEYGPDPSEDKKYHLLEEYGVLVPEFDFLLHEVYRYLDNLYPDHPDYIRLLTDNEFNDFITAAGAVIDYSPDNKFFDSLSNSLGLEPTEARREAAMIKIRNLRNEAFRRKLYGSKAGYRMLANDIYQNATVFPVATYLPLKPVSIDLLNQEKKIANDESLLKEWNKENHKKYNKEEFIEHSRKYNRHIDTYSKYYYKKFRLIDLDGSNSSYPEPKSNSVDVFGYPIPFYESTIFEYPTGTDFESRVETLGVNTFYTGTFDDITRYVIGINPSKGVVEVNYTDKGNNYYNNIDEEVSSTNEIHSFDISYSTVVPYTSLWVYPAMKDIELDDVKKKSLLENYPFIKNNLFDVKPSSDPDKSVLSYFLFGEDDKGFTQEDIDKIVRPFKVIYNPFIKDTLLMEPSESLKFYEKSIFGKRNTVKFLVDEVPISWDTAPIKKGELITDIYANNKLKPIGSLMEVTNFTRGYIDVKIDPSLAENNTLPVSFSEYLADDDRYAAVVENENGDYIVFEGSVSFTEEFRKGSYILKSARLNIAAIPEYKTDKMIAILYENSKELQEKRDTNRTLIDESVKNNGYDEELAYRYIYGTAEEKEKAKKDIEESPLDYSEFLVFVKLYNDANNEINKWKLNRENIYVSEKRKNLEGEVIDTQRGLIYQDSKVTKFLIGSTEKVDERMELDYTLEAKLNSGEVGEISLGNLNVSSLYNLQDGGSSSLSEDVVEDTIDLGDTLLYIVRANKEKTAHDKYEVFDLNGDKQERSYSNEQAFTRMDNHLRNFVASDYKPNNFNTQVSVFDRTDIKIESVIDISTEGNECIISFESDLAKELFKSLSVGDLVTGPSIDSDDNDVYIIYVGDNFVKVNVPLQQSGTYILTYSVKTNTTIEDISENVNMYKADLYKNGLYSVSNPFEHGLWPSKDFPRVSNAILDSLPDISFYKIFESDELTSSMKRNSTLLMDACYNEFDRDIKKEEEKVYCLSDIKFNNELFLELNLNKLLKFNSREGVSPILMGVDWLDYIENSLSYSSRATDNVNVGINLMMETDTTGYYSLLTNAEYTDPAVRLKFITLNLEEDNMWPEVDLTSDRWTVPVYAQVGTGGAGRRSWFKTPDDITYPNIWGNNIYDDIKQKESYDESSEFYKEGGELRKVSVYGKDSRFEKSNIDSVIYQSVENPLFEIPLGEYDTVLRYSPDKSPINTLTITQASFYSQTFNNLLKFFDVDDKVLKINGSDIKQSNILSSFDYSKMREYLDKDGVTKEFKVLPKNLFTYAGEWIPSKKESSKGNYYEIVYPDFPINNTYYVVPKATELTAIGGGKNGLKTVKFSASDVLFRLNDNWFINKFQFTGLIGNAYDIKTEKVTKWVTSSFNLPPSTSEDYSKNFTLFERMIQYYLRTTGFYNTSYIESVLNKSKYRDEEDLEQEKNTKLGLEGLINEVNRDFSDVTLSDSKWDEATGAYHGYNMYFLYIGDFSKSNPIYGDYIKECGMDIKDGDRIVASCIDGKWYLFKINTGLILGASLPVSRYQNMLDSEYAVMTGINVDAKNDGIDFPSTIDSLNSTVKLPRGYITEGSFKFNFTVDPNFLSSGYLYNEDGTIDTKSPIKFDITKGSIYYDDENSAFYTYSNLYNSKKSKSNDKDFEEDLRKIAIKFNEQKYFKNVLNTSCAYQVKNILEEGKSEYTKKPVLSTISGIDFDVSHIEPGDRILEVKEINLRSLYTKNFEPTLFSNYLDVNYNIRGLTEDGNMYLSYFPNYDSISEKVEFATNISEFIPVKYTYSEDLEEYQSAEFSSKDGVLDYDRDGYDSPLLIEPNITKSFITDGNYEKGLINREFGYFKNNLIFRAAMDAANPKNIIVPSQDSGLFVKALEKLTVGDRLVSGYAVNGIYEERKMKIALEYNGTPVSDFGIKRVNFANNEFVAVNKYGKIYFNTDVSLSSITGVINVKKATLNISADSRVADLSYNFSDSSWTVEILDNVVNESGKATGEKTSQSYTLPKLSDDYDGKTIDLTLLYSRESNIFIEDTKEVFGSAVDSIAGGNISFDNVDYTPNHNDMDYIKLNESVITNVGVKFDETVEYPEKEDEMVFYKDHAMSNAVLNIDKKDEKGLAISYKIKDKDMYANEPYTVDTIALLDNKYDGRIKFDDSSKSRSVLISDNSGKYSAYAKGNDLFVKSPTATAIYDEESKKYEYSGLLSNESYWKHCKAPIFNDKNYLEIARLAAENTSKVQSNIIDSGKVAYNQLALIDFDAEEPTIEQREATKFLTINGASISKEHKAELDAMIKVIGDHVGADGKVANGKNIMTYEQLVDAISKEGSKNATESSAIKPNSTNSRLILFYDEKNHDFILRIKGYGFVEETIRNKGENSIGTSIKKFPVINDSLYTDIKIPDTAVINFKGAYANYAYFLDYYLFGNAANTEFAVSSSINKMQFTNDSLFILDDLGNSYRINLANLTKTDDIKNADNWIVSKYPEDFLIRGRRNDLQSKAYYKINDKIFTYSQSSSLGTMPIFKPLTSYINNDVILLGGYYMSKDEIEKVYLESVTGPLDSTKKLEDLTSNQRENLDSYKEISPYDDKSAPAVMYSLDGGISFWNVTLPNIMDDLEKGVPVMDAYVNSIKFVDQEFHFYCDTKGGLENIDNNMYIIRKGEDETYNFRKAEKIKVPTEEIEMGAAYQIDVDSTTGMDSTTVASMDDVQLSETQSSGVPTPSGLFRFFITEDKDFFYMASSKTLSLANTIITSKGAMSFTLSENLIPKSKGRMEMILSFITQNDIPNQAEYLNLSKPDDLLNSAGGLRVQEVSEVENKSLANRFYSFREIALSNDDIKDSLGYPAVVEDREHKFYNYSTTFDIDGNEVEVPIIMKNDAGNDIYLCSSDGKGLLFRDTETFLVNVCKFGRRLNYPSSLFLKANEVKYETVEEADSNTESRVKDTFMTELLGDNLRIIKMGYDSDEPYLLVTPDNKDMLNSVSKFLFAGEDLDNAFRTYLMNVTGEVRRDAEIADITNIKFLNNEGEEVQKYVAKSIGGSEYWFDNELGIFILRNKRFLDSQAYVSYSHKGGSRSYANPDLLKISDKNLYKYPITGIFISNYGYGGARNNLDLWKNTLPWDLDPKAFTNEYLRNSNGDYVYLVDSTGSEIISKNAESSALVGDTVLVERDIFTSSGEKTIKVYNNSASVSQNFYLRKTPNIEIFFPFEDIEICPTENFTSSLFLTKNGFLISKVGKKTNIPTIKVGFRGLKNATEYDIIYDDKYLKFDTDTDELIFNCNGGFNAGKLGLSTIESIVITVTYQGRTYNKEIKISSVNATEKSKTPSVKFDNILGFRQDRNTKKYKFVDFDLEKKSKITSETYILHLKSGENINFTNYNNFTNSDLPIQYKSVSGKDILFTANMANKNISSLKVDKASVSVDNYIFDIMIPILDIGDITSYSYNYFDETSNKKVLQHQSFLGDEKLENIGIVKYEITDNKNGTSLVKSYFIGDDGTNYLLDEHNINNYMLSEELTEDDTYYLNSSEGNVLYYNKDTITLKILKNDAVVSENKVIVSGRKGRVICRCPKYQSFYSLINHEGYVIDGKTVAVYNGTNLSDISLINKENASISLSTMFENQPVLNDGNIHYIKLKILTQKTILSNVETANNPESFVKLNILDIEKFTPDRVWFNPDGYPLPPVTIGNAIFNESSNSEYYNEPYRNSNNYKIYRCNEEGNIIGYRLLEASKYGTIKPEEVSDYILDENGNISSGTQEFEITSSMSLDNAQVPNKPIYLSCQDWFKNEFYLKNHESNPFWQIIEISSKFNNVSKKWEQFAKVCEYNRATASMVLREVPENDRYINISSSLFYKVNDLNIEVFDDGTYVDTNNGVIKFLLNLPASKYKNTEKFVKYGITAENSFYNRSDSNNSKVWIGDSVGLPVYLDSTYTVNSTKNLANPKDKDSEIQSITELGLFNKYHQLIAYAVFPPIEYRTSSQHLSFTCYVKMGSLTDPSKFISKDDLE